jgi:hypothetical protein
MSGDLDDPYKSAIRTLADGARMPPASAARIERDLLNALVEHHAAVTRAPATRRRGEWRPWAAAALIAIAASIAGWRFRSDVRVNNVTQTNPSLTAAPQSGFMELPSAVGLPDFESGAIVRVELTLASLPAYGIDISRAARNQPVEADLLVGQDGQPRAIRLVTNSSRSGQ